VTEKLMKRHHIPVIAIAVALLSACEGDSTLTVRNSSNYVIDEINLAPPTSRTWGPNLLGNDVLFPGEELFIVEIDCGEYDLRIRDELGAECIIERLDLCFSDGLWVIDDQQLAICDLFGS
jgi:hypothetical protein